jgi:hypothetical protein
MHGNGGYGLNRSFVNNGAKRRMQMLIDMERIEAMSDEELIKVSNEDMARFLCTHTAEKIKLMGRDEDENEIFMSTMNHPGLIEERSYREWFYRTVWNRERELKEAKEYGEAMERSFEKSYETGSVKDVNDWLKPEILCFDLRYLSPRQKEALYRLIDDDPDLTNGSLNGPKGTFMTVASKSMTSALPRAEYEEYVINLAWRLG